MEKQLLQSMDPEARKNYLENNADEVEQRSYFKRLTEEELASKKHEFTTNSLSVHDLEEQKKEAVKDFKDQMAPHKEEVKELSKCIRTGFESVEGSLYKFIDHETRMVSYYDESGEIIPTENRPATIEELQQLTISHSIRAANE